MDMKLNEISKVNEVSQGFKDIKPESSLKMQDVTSFWDKKFSDVKSYVSLEERIVHTPVDKEGVGHWQGERGESKYVFENPEIKAKLEKYGIDGIEYKNGLPDFSPITDTTVVNPDVEAFKPWNFKYADTQCAKQWNECARDGKTDWKPEDVKKWRHENRYSWHECADMQTYQLVDMDIHLEYKHTGGVAQYNHKHHLTGGFDNE